MPSKTKLKNAAIAARSAALPKIPNELIDQFVTGPMTGEAVNAASMAFKKALIERAMGAELGHHPGYPAGAPKPGAAANQRNGRSAKTVLTGEGPVRIEVPRDRDGSFEPVLIPKLMLLADDMVTDATRAQERRSALATQKIRAEAALGKIAGQESQRQEALARMANAVDRYIKVYTAAKLLRWSIERFCESKQGPMLARASEVFEGLTQGAFNRLVVDYESEPLKLSGQCATAELVDIEGMSEGTREQLYLALRLSALELHLEQTASLPFMADDLFINYDDGRARAGRRK